MEVDRILDNWFGESLEHSNNEDRLRKYLYNPLRLIENERDQLRLKVSSLENNLSMKKTNNVFK